MAGAPPLWPALAGLYVVAACGYGTGVGDSAVVTVAGGVHGFPAALTSFVGREGPLGEVSRLLAGHRLVTVTGPGGSGKTRLAGEVARRVAGRFADGAWLAELASIQDPEQVAAVVAAALGVREQPGLTAAEALARVLARQQMLLVLDNCEHVIGAAAALCAGLLLACDDVRVLATSREPLRVGGEARYRLGPLALPGRDDPADAGRAEAVALFADRARDADAHFLLDEKTASAVAKIVARLDGMPLAIELAAAQVEALGLAGLLDRLDDRFALLAAGDRLAPSRQRSLAAAVQWSYQLLDEQQQRVFRAVSVFSGPFTLEAAEAVAGDGAGPVVLRLVDCSLLTPPRAGPDGRLRYVMLETLRAYGAARLAEAGEQGEMAAALARWALRVAQEAAVGLQTRTGESEAARWLDAEDAGVHQALVWALEHDPGLAAQLAVALAPWWLLRGRWATGYRLLAAAAEHAEAGGEAWCAIQFWLGALAMAWDIATSFSHLTAVRDALAGRAPTPLLVRALLWRAGCLTFLGRPAEATGEARHALSMARELDDREGEAYALFWLGHAALYAHDTESARAWLLEAQRLDSAAIPGWVFRLGANLLAISLIDAGEVADAQRYCADALAMARRAGSLFDQGESLRIMADLDIVAGRTAEASAHLRQAIELCSRIGHGVVLIDCLDSCAYLSAATGRWPEALTMGAACTSALRAAGMQADLPHGAERREQTLRKARQALGPVAARAAEQRGAAMNLGTAIHYALLLVAEEPGRAAGPAGAHALSARERELVTLVAQGATNAQIAAQLFISIRTVSSHLDRIRDKTGCRRRADLTRLALAEGLV